MSKVGTASREEIQLAKAELDKVFYGDSHMMGSRPKLWDAVKDMGIPYRVVNAYYENQEVVQIFKPIKKPSANLKIRTDEPFKILFMDTMVIDEFFLINTIDLFTKFASSMVFKKAVTSEDSVKALKKFMESAKISLEDIEEVRTDGGPEFRGAFTDFVGDKREVSLPYAKTEMSPIERFNGTLRRILEKQKSYFGKPISYIYKYLPQAINAYNKSEHSSTGYSPIELMQDKEAQVKVAGKRTVPKNPDPAVRRGATVRISVRDAMNPFDRKIGANWSLELYEVTNVRGTRVGVVPIRNNSHGEAVPSLDDGKKYDTDVRRGAPKLTLKIHEVRAIDPDLLMNRIKKQKSRRQKNKNNTEEPPQSEKEFEIHKTTRSGTRNAEEFDIFKSTRSGRK